MRVPCHPAAHRVGTHRTLVSYPAHRPRPRPRPPSEPAARHEGGEPGQALGRGRVRRPRARPPPPRPRPRSAPGAQRPPAPRRKRPDRGVGPRTDPRCPDAAADRPGTAEHDRAEGDRSLQHTTSCRRSRRGSPSRSRHGAQLQGLRALCPRAAGPLLCGPTAASRGTTLHQRPPLGTRSLRRAAQYLVLLAGCGAWHGARLTFQEVAGERSSGPHHGNAVALGA